MNALRRPAMTCIAACCDSHLPRTRTNLVPSKIAPPHPVRRTGWLRGERQVVDRRRRYLDVAHTSAAAPSTCPNCNLATTYHARLTRVLARVLLARLIGACAPPYGVSQIPQTPTQEGRYLSSAKTEVASSCALSRQSCSAQRAEIRVATVAFAGVLVIWRRTIVPWSQNGTSQATVAAPKGNGNRRTLTS